MQTISPTDLAAIEPHELVNRIASGNRDAESQLVARYSRPLMTMLQQRTGDIQHAEDVHQETFCIVLERLRGKGVEEPAKIAAFIHNTARNVLIGNYRKTARRKTHADSELIQEHGDSRPNQLQQLIQNEASVAVREVIGELSVRRDREILRRFYILQQEKPTICLSLDLSNEHFDRVIARARKRFRALIEEKHNWLQKGAGR